MSVIETDATLVALAQGGDVAAFDRIISRYERTIYSVAVRILRDRAMAEDATQDALLKAWTAIDSFTGETVLPWLVRIVTNRCYYVVRVRNRRRIESLDQEDVYETTSWQSQSTRCEGPADFLDRSELSSRLQAAIAALNPDQRAVVMLADIHGYAYEEIAAMLGLAVGTVKSRLSRGRGHLRTMLIGTVGHEVARHEAELTLR